MVDVEDAQSPEGGFSDVSPRVVTLGDGAPAWGDAGVIVPWTLYLCHGDRGVLERHYDAMARWIRYVDAANTDHVWRHRVNMNYGDWVAAGSPTPKEVLSTAYFARSAYLMARIARVLGRFENARRYERLFEAVRAAFAREFVTPSGRIMGDTQTA
jgi:alpha-L-rhamnosidase